MKTKFFSLLLSLILFSTGIVTFSSCGDDDDDTPPILVEDGTYIMGDAFAYNELKIEGQMEKGINEVDQKERDGMYDKYVTLTAAGGFNIVVVTGKTQKTYGPNVITSVDLKGVADHPAVTIQKGTFKETTEKFKVPADGLYKIVLDNQLGLVAIIPVTKWGVIGGATLGGWGADQPLPLTSAFSKTTLTYEAKDMIFIPGEYKFRQDGGWKVNLDADGKVKTNTNLGGTLTAFVPGGTNMIIPAGGNGKYTVNLTWTLATGFKGTLTKTGDYTPETYPAEMFIVGDATAYGWDTPGTKPDAAMHKCAGGAPLEGIYWKICYIEAGKGFKVSNANWGNVNLGFGDIKTYDPEGKAVSDLGGNMSIAESGMYIVVLNLRDNTKKLSVKIAEVYGMGDAFGGWTEDVPANLFKNDNATKTLTSPALTANGNIRMYAHHSWIKDWWNAEFRVANGKIEYRNDGGDQEAVPGTAGKVINLKFDDNTGSIQ